MDELEEKKTHLPWFGLPVLWPYLRPYKRQIAFVFVQAGASVCEIAFPLFQQYAINHFVQAENAAAAIQTGLGWFIAAYLLMLVVYIFINTYSVYATCELEMYTARDLRRDAFDHLQTLTASYYNSHNVGYIHSRLISDTGRISSILSWVFLDIVWSVAYAIGAMISMLVLDWKLGLCVLAIVPIAIAVSAFFKQKLTGYFHKVREANSIVTGKLNEGITGARTAKSLVIEDRLQGKFENASGNMMKTSVRMARWRSLYVSVFSLISSLTLALILWRGGIVTAQGVMLIGTLSAFLSYVTELINCLTRMVGTVSQLINSQVNIERFHTLMTTETEVKDTPEVIEKYGDIFTPKTENWETLLGEIAFDDVTFQYPDGTEKVLEHFDLTIPQGTNCAIVGETGAGKSTLVNLVCRFFEPTEGRVLIDGRDVRERSQGWLHANIGYVLQTPHLFTGSVRENLLYGNPDASDEQMKAAVKSVAAEEIIERMGGYDADVGEGGDLLSTGEKQLLSFARALIADPRIFILDEATSSIDTLTEKKLQNAIETVMKGRTSLVIAHRLSTIRQADMILVARDGKIVERGTHEELLKLGGYYRDLYLRQFRNEAAQ